MPYLKLKVNTLGHREIFLERYCLTSSKRGRNKTQTKGIEKFFYHQDLFYILKGHHHASGIKSVSLSSQHLNLALSGRIGIIWQTVSHVVFFFVCFWRTSGSFLRIFSSVALHRGRLAAKCHLRWQPTRQLSVSCGLGRCRIRTRDCRTTVRHATTEPPCLPLLSHHSSQTEPPCLPHWASTPPNWATMSYHRHTVQYSIVAYSSATVVTYHRKSSSILLDHRQNPC